jgi:peptidyl-prolyl cis-trans isomerase C
MKRSIIAAFTLLAAGAAFAQVSQSAATAASDQEKIVAVINGETITKAKLDALYNAMPVQMRTQYEKAGGKMAFLDYLVEKRLLLQEAMKSGFDKRRDVQAALESAKDTALYNKYVHDIVAADVVTPAEVRKYYDEHKTEFVIPESVKVRHIVISWNKRPKPAAFDLAKQVAQEIRVGAPVSGPDAAQVLERRFIQAAKQYSEDGVAQAGGDLGWVARGSLDKNFEDAAFGMRPMTMSGIVESQFGYHLILVEAKKPESIQSFDEAKADVREFLMAQRVADVMGSVKRLTNELRASSKVAFYPENVK